MKSRHRKYFFFEHVLSFSRILPVGITLRSRFSTTEESQPHLVSVIPVSFVQKKKKVPFVGPLSLTPGFCIRFQIMVGWFRRFYLPSEEYWKEVTDVKRIHQDSSEGDS